MCRKYYDPDLIIHERSELMIFAMIRGKSKAVVKRRFLKNIHNYMRNNRR